MSNIAFWLHTKIGRLKGKHFGNCASGIRVKVIGIRILAVARDEEKFDFSMENVLTEFFGAWNKLFLVDRIVDKASEVKLSPLPQSKSIVCGNFSNLLCNR